MTTMKYKDHPICKTEGNKIDRLLGSTERGKIMGITGEGVRKRMVPAVTPSRAVHTAYEYINERDLDLIESWPLPSSHAMSQLIAFIKPLWWGGAKSSGWVDRRITGTNAKTLTLTAQKVNDQHGGLLGGEYVVSQVYIVGALSLNRWFEKEWMLEEHIVREHTIGLSFVKNRYEKGELVWGDEYE